MQFISHGAAREVTGSCHELQIAGKRILLDCGLFQGRRKEAVAKNASFPFDPAKDIDAMILSHAHSDHVGRIPLLWKQGYRGPIYCTYATKDLAEVMLADSAYIQEKDEEYFRKHLPETMLPSSGPLYTQEDAKACMALFWGKNYNEWFEVLPGISVQFIEAGHILGAAMVVMEVDEKAPHQSPSLRSGSGSGRPLRVGFSGDLGRSMLPVIRDPAKMPPVSSLICESTYGNRMHGDIATAKAHLREALLRTAQRGGKMLIPAFSLERTQEIIYDLHLLWDAREIPAIPIYIDSPLASKVTEIFMKHPECYDKEMYEQFLGRAHNPFQFSLVKYTESVEESKRLNTMPGPMVIMAGSGMCEGGRIRHHLRNGIEDPRNTVMVVGYMAQHTLGHRIVDPEVTAVKIFDEVYEKRAEVTSIDAYSAHADMQDLDRFVLGIEGLQKLILVHGEVSQMEAFKERLRQASKHLEVHMPEREEEILL